MVNSALVELPDEILDYVNGGNPFAECAKGAVIGGTGGAVTGAVAGSFASGVGALPGAGIGAVSGAAGGCVSGVVASFF